MWSIAPFWYGAYRRQSMGDVLRDLSDGLAAMVERAGPGVVRVEGRRRGPSSGVVWSEGVIVTTSHVLDWDEGIEIGLPDGRTTKANVVGRDPGTDLAALKVEAGGLTPAPWREPDGLKAGHLVVSLSRPGQRVRAGLGMVTVRGDGWWTPNGGRLDADVRVDIGLHPGFSGSLLVDASGAAVGLNTAGLVRATPTLVPTATIRRVVGALLTHGHLRRGFLGIGTQGVRLPADLAQSLGQPEALLIVNVLPNTPAAKAGLLLGDALVSLDGHPLRQPGDLLPLLDEERIGREAVVKIVRAGRREEVRVTVGEPNGGPEDPR
jgi:S1-C subfamily serine protease